MQDEIFAELLVDYLEEASERVARLEEALLLFDERATLDERAELVVGAKRELHTLKGNSGMMGLHELQELVHELEELLAGTVGERETRAVLAGLDRLRSALSELRPRGESTDPARGFEGAPAGDAILRVPAATIDRLVEQMSELVTLRNRLMSVIGRGKRSHEGLSGRVVEGDLDAWTEAGICSEALQSGLNLLREDLLRLRMVPLKPVLRSLKRLVHNESTRAGKQVELSLRGEETPLDRSLSELAGETLGHLVRNAVCHGIETPAERQRSGKSPTGTVLVEASVNGSSVVVDVLDDGGGIDGAALQRAARAAGIDHIDESDLHGLVFHPGLSSRPQVGLAAGRGIGMSAVLEAVHRSGGFIELKTVAGVGTHFRLQLPLRVAISDVLLLGVDGATFALPASSILEAVELENAELDGAPTIEWRGRVASIIDLGRAMGTAPGRRARAFAAIVETEGRLRALMVDDLGELEEIVVRPLDPVLGTPPGISGSSLLGDGRVVLILDPTTLSVPQPALQRSA